MATFTDRDAIREGYGKPRRRFSHPGRRAQALATSGAGIVHREMMDLQRQPELNKADTGRLKELRRDWNRNRKYTDAGMALAGVTTPQGAQDAFMRSTEDFRQLNKPAYNKMYPLTGGFMDYAGKGGMWGSMLSGLAGKTRKNITDYGKDLLEKKGILGTVDSSPQDQVEYADQTFGPNMYDIAGPWFGTAPLEDVEISDLPDETLRVQKQDWVDDITETDLPDELQDPPSFWDHLYPWGGVDPNIGRETVIPGYGTTYIEEPDEKYEEYIERGEEPLPITPYDDSAHEFGMGIGKFFKEMPESMKPDWEDYLEYVGRLGDMPGGKLTYDEWQRMMRRRR